MNENGQRWLEAVAARSTFEEEEGIRQRILGEKTFKERRDAIYEVQRGFARFFRSEEFPAALALLKSLKRKVFLGERAGSRYLLTEEGLVEYKKGEFTLLGTTTLDLEYPSEVFFCWKGPSVRPEDYLTDQLNEIAEEALRPLTLGKT